MIKNKIQAKANEGRKMTTILGQMMYNLGKREDELTEMRHLLRQKCQNFNEFLTELENNKDINMKEKFYIIAIMTLEWNQKYYARNTELMSKDELNAIRCNNNCF